MAQKQIAREKVRYYGYVPDCKTGEKKYFIIGTGTASAAINMNNTNKDNKSITQTMGNISITRGSWTFQITENVDTSDNIHNYITINTLRGNMDELILDVLIVFEYIHKQGDVGTVLAFKGKASSPLTSIGGEGQDKLQLDATLSTSGDLTAGSIKLNECGLKGSYNPEVDTYGLTDFTEGKMATNLEPPANSEETKKEDTGQDTQAKVEGTDDQQTEAGLRTEEQNTEQV